MEVPPPLDSGQIPCRHQIPQKYERRAVEMCRVGCTNARRGGHHGLNAAAIAADLLRLVLHAFRAELRIGCISGGERVLILGGTVADSLSIAVAICRAEPPVR